MATITPILVTDLVSNGPDIINTNFNNLNTTGTETSPGLLEIATNAEVEAQTDDSRAITPSKLAFGFTRTKDILPVTTSIYDLGSTSKLFSDLWLSNEINFNSQTFEVDSNGDILVNGSIFTGASTSGQFIELSGAQTASGIKTWTSQQIHNANIDISGDNLNLIFNQKSNGKSGIIFQDNGSGIAEIRYDDTARAIVASVFDSFTYSWQFTSEIIFGEGEKTAPNFVASATDNGITASKLKRFKRHVNDSVTSVSGDQVSVDWSGSPVFNLFLDEGESGQVIIAHKETDIFLPPLTRDGGSTNSGGTTYTIVNMSNNDNVEIFANSDISDLINGSTSLSNLVRFSSITIVGTFKKQFGTGSKEGHWVITSTQGTWA